MAAPVTIAVVSWNTADLLERCLSSLRREHEAGRAEVWVVDNASSDGSVARVRSSHSWAHLIASGENLGFGAAVDLVAERTSSPYLVAANADVALLPGALGALLSAAADHPRAGALAPRLLLPDGSTQHSVHPFPGVRTGLLLSSGLAFRKRTAARLPLEGHWDATVARDVDWAHGAFLLLRRSAWDAVGGFDPSQWLYAEDLDLAWRLRRAGWSTRYVPGARVEHAVSAAARERWDDHERALRTQRSAYAWMLARRGRIRTRTVALAHLVGPATRSRVLRALARVRPERFAARAEQQRRYAAMHRTGLESARSLRAHRAARA